MSRRLAECALFQWFCGIDQLAVVSVPSKSQMQRYTHWLPSGQVEEMIEELLQSTVRTEGRIGILKNEFFGNPMRSRGIAHRKLGVAWSVLAHNLWVLARLERTRMLNSPGWPAAIWA